MSDTPDTLPFRPISRAAFAPFGHLAYPANAGVSVNDGTAIRHDVHYFDAAEADPTLSLVTSVFEVRAQALPRSIGKLERHPRSSQLIMPISVDEHIVLVCSSRPDGEPDPATLTAFRLSGRHGVVYRPGLWHHPILAAGRNGLFLVQSWQDGSRRDCETRSILPVSIG